MGVWQLCALLGLLCIAAMAVRDDNDIDSITTNTFCDDLPPAVQACRAAASDQGGIDQCCYTKCPKNAKRISGCVVPCVGCMSKAKPEEPVVVKYDNIAYEECNHVKFEKYSDGEDVYYEEDGHWEKGPRKDETDALETKKAREACCWKDACVSKESEENPDAASCTKACVAYVNRHDVISKTSNALVAIRDDTVIESITTSTFCDDLPPAVQACRAAASDQGGIDQCCYTKCPKNAKRISGCVVPCVGCMSKAKPEEPVVVKYYNIAYEECNHVKFEKYSDGENVYYEEDGHWEKGPRKDATDALETKKAREACCWKDACVSEESEENPDAASCTKACVAYVNKK